MSSERELCVIIGFLLQIFYLLVLCLCRERLTIAADPENMVFGSVEYHRTGNLVITSFQGIDQATDGYGGLLNSVVGGTFTDSVTLGFQSVGANLTIDFIVEFYGYESEW